MLTSLTVDNFAIIDHLHLEFTNGFTVLTGETGAGKSLIIDAIGLLLGNRFSTSMIRQGATKTIIEGIFDQLSEHTKAILATLEIDLFDETTLIIRRELSNTGKSMIRMNGIVITLNQLEKIAHTLADIHTQEDTHKLFEPRSYISLIETSASLVVLEDYKTSYRQYLVHKKAYEELEEQSKLAANQIDYLQFQFQELTKAELKVNEIEQLEEELKFLNNFETIYKNLADIKKLFQEQNILESIYSITNHLDKLASLDLKYKKLHQTIENAYYDLEDSESTLSNALYHLEFDENRVNHINERMSHLKNWMRKYHRSIAELIDYRAELADKIDQFTHKDDILSAYKNNVKVSYEKLCNVALVLHHIREQNAVDLKHHIQLALQDLLLEKVQLEIVFRPIVFTDIMDDSMFQASGCDEIEFFISFNPGEPLKELAKVASGGEMSRVMLALKTHLLKNLKLTTMIFDEIDSGVSGAVASGVAQKLKQISKNTQVLAITHLPIVASIADQHVFIYKQIIADRTITSVKNLSITERIDEIAQMISPNDNTNKSKELAKLMLESCQ